MAVLHVNSSARLEDSNSRIVSHYLVDQLKLPVIHRDVGQQPLPFISAEDLLGVHGSADSQRASLQAQLALSETLIDELRRADTLVLAAPMYNFSVPASMKQWIDAVCRAGVSFKYTDQGPVGLLGVERAIVVTSSGGVPIGGDMDFASPYLERICHFIGIKEVFHISVSGSKGDPEQVIASGKQQVDDLLAQLKRHQ